MAVSLSTSVAGKGRGLGVAVVLSRHINPIPDDRILGTRHATSACEEVRVLTGAVLQVVTIRPTPTLLSTPHVAAL